MKGIAGPSTQALLVLLAHFAVPTASQKCDLSGIWTSTLDPTVPASEVVQIQIKQDGDYLMVQATPWGDKVGKGQVSKRKAAIRLVGSDFISEEKILRSPFPAYGTELFSPTDCTYISFGWCKFPYCPIRKPEFSPLPTPPFAPACASNPPCQPPPWKHTYQLNMSTVAQPCNRSGYFEDGHLWGLTSYDWQNAQAIWSQNPPNSTNCSLTLVEQAKRVKALNPDAKVLVYRNFELALEWLESERDVMNDPTKKDMFLHYQTGNMKGQIYNEPRSNGNQYFWNFSNPKAVSYFIQEVALGPNAVGSPYIDGIYTDDVGGTFQEHANATANMGLSPDQVQQLYHDNQIAYTQLLDALRSHNGYNWQAFGAGDEISKPPTQENCADVMRDLCRMNMQPLTVQISVTDETQSVAAFLIARGDYWYLGHGWESCSDNPIPRPKVLDTDVGEPLGDCEEISPRTFSRRYSKGTAVLDCNNWEAFLNF